LPSDLAVLLAAHDVLHCCFAVNAVGGQFAFTELLTDMKTPTEFTKSISVCTIVMGSLYASLGAVGYWSKGLNVADIVIFSLGQSPIARVAAACILLQVGLQSAGSCRSNTMSHLLYVKWLVRVLILVTAPMKFCSTWQQKKTPVVPCQLHKVPPTAIQCTKSNRQPVTCFSFLPKSCHVILQASPGY
jgi:hypothetical protein